MNRAGRLPIYVDRETVWDQVLVFKGVDLSTAEMKMQVRLYPNAPGDPLVALTTSPSGPDGIRFQGLDIVDGVEASRVQFLLGDGAVGNLPVTGVEAADPTELAYDLLVKLPFGYFQRWLYGPFVVVPGVTIP